MKTQEFAIVNDVKTDHAVIAVCEVWTYDVWGNTDDGWEVNNRFPQSRDARLACECRVSNLPRHPGASDDFRSWPADSSSFSAEVCVSFELSDETIRETLGGVDDGQGDGSTYYVEDDDGKPIGEIVIVGYESE